MLSRILWLNALNSSPSFLKGNLAEQEPIRSSLTHWGQRMPFLAVDSSTSLDNQGKNEEAHGSRTEDRAMLESNLSADPGRRMPLGNQGFFLPFTGRVSVFLRQDGCCPGRGMLRALGPGLNGNGRREARKLTKRQGAL